ncbi:MAG: hypothetical protein WC717_02955 [Candidatus Micrarchaeia archaeon]|jgi:hypothetical protein
MSRGFVFSMDATFAAFLTVLVIVTMAFLSVQAEDDPYSKVQMARIGSDALFLMDRQGALSSGNASLIEASLSSALPQGLEASLVFETYRHSNGTFGLASIEGFGAEAPGNMSMYGVRRDFVAMRNGTAENFTVVRMAIWQK